MSDLKTYVIKLAKTYPKGHTKAGQKTNFAHKVKLALASLHVSDINVGDIQYVSKNEVVRYLALEGKIHTIRQNYDYWKRIVDQVNAGRGFLSVREWIGVPYKSGNRELFQFRKLGIQKVSLIWDGFHEVHIDGKFYCSTDGAPNFQKYLALAANDGLDYIDFQEWFPKDLIGGCIIHFTDFRY